MRRWATILLLLLPAAAQDGGGGIDGGWRPGEPGGPSQKQKDAEKEKPKEPPKEEPPPSVDEEDGCGEEVVEAPEAPAEPAPEGVDPIQAEFDRAVEKQKKGQWVAAKRAFRKFVKNHPDHPLAPIARDRGGDNALLGVEVLQQSGPPERRIDVTVMGDGFTIEGADQKMQRQWAEHCLDVLYDEKVFEEYKSYFNFYFVRLASLEEGVDPGLSPEELKKAQERNLQRRRALNYKLDYSTALDCKAAGPQGQVMADPALVYKWLDAAAKDLPGSADDRFVIAFARFGVLGMGGGGIANVGRPDKSVTVHEFGHAFSRLLDEYAVNPASPAELGMYGRTIVAANAHVSPEEPKPEEVPWAHLLKKRVKGVGIYEGGATFKKGVWRPAASCAMNIGGNQFCPVCREQTLLVIYEYVSPIDVATPDPAKDLEVVAGSADELVVLPMQPEKHRLKVSWHVQKLAVTTGDGQEAAPEDAWPMEGDAPPAPLAYPQMANPYMGRRVQSPRDAYDEPPPGKPSPLGQKARKRKDGALEYAFPVGKLPAGGYLITAEVRDDTDWVVKDEKHLLEERVSWRVKVAPAKPSAAAPPSPNR